MLVTGLMVAGSPVVPPRLITPAFAQAKPKADKAVELNADMLAPLGSEKEKGRTVQARDGDFWPVRPTESPVADATWEIAAPEGADAAPTTTTSLIPAAAQRSGANKTHKRDPKLAADESPSNAADTAKRWSSGKLGGFSRTEPRTNDGKSVPGSRVAPLVDIPENTGSEPSPKQNTGASSSKAKGGFDKEKSKESQRDPASVLYDNADGSKTAVVYGAEMNVADESGKLAPMDQQLVTKDGGRVKAKQAKIDVGLAPRTNDPSLISDQGVELQLTQEHQSVDQRSDQRACLRHFGE